MLCLPGVASLAFAVLDPSCCPTQKCRTIANLPGRPAWQNAPVSWGMTQHELTIHSRKHTDWFVDPFDGAVHNNAPMLLFKPDHDFVFRVR